MAKKSSASKGVPIREGKGVPAAEGLEAEPADSPAHGRASSKRRAHAHTSTRTKTSKRTPPAHTPSSKRTATKEKAKPRARASSGATTRAASGALTLTEDFPQTRYLFFGGKGGVGKTTAAAATALALLDAAREGERVLLFSTDPAHSLADSLGTQVGDRTVEVARRGAGERAPRLFAREMDAALALEEFKQKHRGVLAEIADRGTILDEADINDLLDLSLPGMDEVMALFELSEVERAEAYSRVVVDTAPSGHTSRMLRLPGVFARWVGALDVMSEKHRYMVAHFARGGRVRADEVDLFLRDLTARVEAMRSMLFDPARAAFVLVVIPEAMAFEESARYYKTLLEEGAPVTDLVVNRVEREHDGCPFCRARVSMQTRWLGALEREFKALRTRRVPLFPAEVRGPEALREFARAVWKDEGGEMKDKGRRMKDEGNAVFTSAFISPPSSFRLESRRLVIFGGKGGVGKTTAAASYALAVAARDEAARVLLFSTDPAHSLADSFDEPVGELKRGVGGRANLDAMEIDPAARFEELKERYRRWTDELFESLTGGSRWEVQFDREAMRELVALAPPGIDEIAALSIVSDLVDADAYATIVIDTAPTGHLLRFLELPGVALAWVRTFIKLLLKYKNVVRWGGVAEELVALSKSIKRVAALLADADHCEFVGVAIPERMSLEETVRLAASLERRRVPVRRLLVNNVLTEEAARACDFCAARRRGQVPVVEEFRRRLADGVEIFLAPQQPGEVRGRKRLREHFESWHRLATERTSQR
ncbi:MAG: arsenite/tail-anchored protein-transporting ATPase [Acidobacteriota bacterium]|nr:arsenite/tail-anchored protein-transporting ATPase [Acidobacteriota bacterium]